MEKKQILPNVVFGNWTVISTKKYIQRGHIMIECRCSCGNITRVKKWTLLNSSPTHCRKCTPAHNKWKSNKLWRGYGEISLSYFKRLERGAKRRNISFSLTIKQLNSLLIKQNFKCALTKLPISLEDKTASVDRISPKKGYIRGNIQWVHKDINRMKNIYDEDYFINLCILITENRK